MKTEEVHQLENWFKKSSRDLPWRKTREPYLVWISELMSQQTTMKALLPYYERFMEKFPNLETLAQSSLEEVYQIWAGLGYPSRAKNLHLSAQIIYKSGFPSNYEALLELPGIGPYTAAAISSIAFKQPIGVVDGNVIRVLSRYLGESIEHWKSSGRNQLQVLMNKFVHKSKDPGIFNQSIMELGALICTKTKPQCAFCPLSKNCVALKKGWQEKLPLPKPALKNEMWFWSPTLIYNKKGELFTKSMDVHSPFLKKVLVPPGEVKKIREKPSDFDFQHQITKYKIYVKINKSKNTNLKSPSDGTWIKPQQLIGESPFSILKKILEIK